MNALLLLPLLVVAEAAAPGSESRERVVDARGGIAVIYGESTPTPGSGRRVRQTRPVGAFGRIVTDDAVDVEVRIGRQSAIELEADDNLIGRMTVETRDGVLRLGVRGGFRTKKAPLARVTVPRLDRIDFQTSSNGRISGLSGGRLRLTSIGSGSFDASGHVDAVEVVMDGSGDADLNALNAARAKVVVNGTGDVRVHARQTLDATVNGTGRIIYRGNPTQVTRAVNGPGSIHRARN